LFFTRNLIPLILGIGTGAVQGMVPVYRLWAGVLICRSSESSATDLCGFIDFGRRCWFLS